MPDLRLICPHLMTEHLIFIEVPFSQRYERVIIVPNSYQEPNTSE